MKITLKQKQYDGKVRQNRKERDFTHEYAVLCPTLHDSRFERISPVVTLRIYSTQSRNYACVWINNGAAGIHLSGGGYAGGYGYHRASAAAQAALNDAGVILGENISGVGDSAIERALLAVARKVTGRKNCFIHYAHA